MKKFKILSLIMTSTITLTACGSGAEAELTDKTTELKKEVKRLKSKIEDEKTDLITKQNTLKSTDNEIKQLQGNAQMSNHEFTTHFNSYAASLALAIKNFSAIENKLSEQNDLQIKDSLSTIKTDVKDTIHEYDRAFKNSEPPAAFKDVHRQVNEANGKFDNAISLIHNGYDESDTKKITQGKAMLHDAIDAFDKLTIE
ncbi:hypothetical protein ETI05_02255 [Macrococcoides canis]|uniref:hypothetical protein n=1 Tax=Macrococcoides canis TaxID=1855823 RepID=UPI0010613FF0|nr:hypothetical protein [Macrococcus canis]MEE1107679.1 hypothetical protein [Macrococcus canis]TDM21582.1 hypothetical protein ETI05_02255 [Macrococcus canis]TDM23547.1 hypothetical protein ETI02_03850 [Macrococcus canis]TDM31722.1 hypothetical protein ETI03_05225 [Macrococcus canis]TDM38322.1 hypothetical protein ETI11_02705 [Macrococcus canis]